MVPRKATKLENPVQIVQKLFFLVRGEEIEIWFWHIWLAQWLTFFPTTDYFFRFRPSSSWTKRANFGSISFSWKFESFKFFQTMLLFAKVLPLVRISTILGYILGRKGPNPPKKSHFMNAESTRKTQFFNLTITNAILMKLTMVMYLPKSVNWKPLRARNSVF